MQSILEELYMGNIGFDARYYPKGTPFADAVQKRWESRNQLEALLDGKSRELFDRYSDAEGDIDAISRYDTFTSALRFGMRLMMEVLCGSDPPVGITVPSLASEEDEEDEED